MKGIILIIMIACFTVISTFGQSAQIIDGILDTKEATFGQASYLILSALGEIPEDTDFKTAFIKLQEKNLINSSVSADDILSFKHYAFLLMQSFDIQGGMCYRIYPCPRYAYRDLRFLSVLQGKVEPDKAVSGLEMLQAIGRVDMLQGGVQ